VRAAYDPRRGRYAAGAAFGLPAPALPVPDAGELEALVRFEHPEKFLAVKELPGAVLLSEGFLAAAYGCSPSALASARRRLAARLEAAAGELLGDPELREAVERFPLAAGGTLVAIGDSITDDRLSWAELLRCCLDRVRPGEVTVVNAGVSGDTTADALERLYGVSELAPDLVIAMLGTNDRQLHGPHRAPLLSPADSVANASAISGWLTDAGARAVWLTPPPADRTALATTVADRPFDLDIRGLTTFTRALTSSSLEVVDTGAHLTAPEDLEPDGVHPSLTGQTKIAKSVLCALGHSNRGGAGVPGQKTSGAGQP
jgi:acyl-CoA thioesterase I